jgi:RND superfamily putative drug exporter
MLERMARLVVRRRKLVLVLTGVAFVVAGAFGAGVFGSLKTGGFDDPGAESTKVRRILRDQFGQAEPNLVLVVTAKQGSVDDPAAAAAGQALTAQLSGEEDIQLAVSYWSLGSPPPLKSTAGNRALVLATIRGDDTHVTERVKDLLPRYERSDATLQVQVSGLGAVFEQVGTTIEKDLQSAETIAFPLTALALIIVFGSVVAAGLPLAIGVLSIVSTFAVLHVIALLTDVSIFSINLATAMGLGLAIDYALFIVTRFREERQKGFDTDEAVVRSVLTAGRTVLFSALTVAASLAALLVFPLYFLRSFAYAGVAVVAAAAIGAIVVLPATLAALGPNVDRFRLLKREPKPVGEGIWHRLAVNVMRRPLPIALAVGAVLLVLGAPFLGVRFGLPDDRVLPAEASTRKASELLRTDFNSRETATLSVVSPSAKADDLTAYAGTLSALPGVARVDGPAGSFIGGRLVLAAGANPLYARFVGPKGGAFVSVVPAVEPLSAAGERLVAAVRDVPAPAPVLVGGQSAQLVDSKASLIDKLPLALGIIAVITFVVLFLMFGSLLVPAKAVVLNLLSLTATFGAMVWVFQEGHGAGLLDFTATGTLDMTTPILMFCVAFGLSMDYEVFLLSRIKEEHDRGSDTVRSVAMGLERTGRLVTAAAALLAIVFIAFATSGITFIKLFGIGLAMAVLMDATLIRGLLVPAFMRLAGEANWWAPGPLRRIHERFGFSEASDLPDAPVALDESTGGPADEREPVTVGGR